MRRIFMSAAAAVLILLGCYSLYLSQSLTFIIISTLLWIGGYACWIMASPQSYNETMDLQKVVELPKKSVQEICRDMRAIETPLGKPWIGKIWSLKKAALIYGPDETGSFVYGHWSNGLFCLAGSDDTDLLEPTEEEAWRLDSVAKSRQAQAQTVYEDVSLAGVLAALVELYSIYGKKGRAPDKQEVQAIFGKNGKLTGELYAFTEDFKLSGQRFYLQDMAGKVLYDIDGTFPLKTIRIKKHDSDQVLFKVTKRILHLLPQYDFYKGEEEKIGSFAKKIAMAHDLFQMELPEGTLTMRSVAATIGVNYLVKIDGRQIGTISENLNLDLKNILFDNMVIEVFDEKYRLLMAALGIMAAREMARDA